MVLRVEKRKWLSLSLIEAISLQILKDYSLLICLACIKLIQNVRGLTESFLKNCYGSCRRCQDRFVFSLRLVVINKHYFQLNCIIFVLIGITFSFLAFIFSQSILQTISASLNISLLLLYGRAAIDFVQQSKSEFYKEILIMGACQRKKYSFKMASDQ